MRFSLAFILIPCVVMGIFTDAFTVDETDDLDLSASRVIYADLELDVLSRGHTHLVRVASYRNGCHGFSDPSGGS